MRSMTAALYIVATPIGNLADMTLRALEVLKTVSAIAAEDTRHSRKLLNHYGIHTPLFSLHQHNEQQRIKTILTRLEQGENLALISDAGTPLISDPGSRLVDSVIQAGFKVVPIPGPCALIAALSVAGLATDEFRFVGFLPAKGQLRRDKVSALAKEARTIVMYESVHRIVNLLELLLEFCQDERQVSVARELTKTYETVYRGQLSEVFTWIKTHQQQQKGEFVVVLAGAEKVLSASLQEQQRIMQILLDELPSLKQAVQVAVKISGAGRKALYQLALDLRSDHEDSQ